MLYGRQLKKPKALKMGTPDFLSPPRMPKPTLRGLIFVLGMLAAPFVGLWVADIIGFFAGSIISCVGTFWFFFIRKIHGFECERCKRQVINFGANSPFYGLPGVLLDSKAVKLGLEGPGLECLKCGRVYCSQCYEPWMSCVCGSKELRLVRLQLRHTSY